MAKYKVGDIVRIREDLKIDNRGASVVNDMLRYRGSYMTIRKVLGEYDGYDTYLLENDSGYFSWNDYMFEEIVTPIIDIESFESFLLE